MKVKIERIDHMGNGIGYLNNKIIFVPKTIPGDEINVLEYLEHKKYYRATKIEYDKYSPEHIAAFCPYYDKCGGCHLQNFNYNRTLEYKKDRVVNILSRADIDIVPEVIANNNGLNYRNKIELKIKNGQLGFYESQSHNLIPIDKCDITKNAINNFFNEILKMNIQNGDIMIRCNYNNELLINIKSQDKITLNKDDYPLYKVVGIILNDKLLYGEDHFLEKIKDIFFEVSYDSFFQVNSYINEKLFDLIKENVEGDVVLDLYSGVGTLSIMASKKAKEVYAIENIPNAVVNAIKNAKINNANNIKFILGNVEDKIKYIDSNIDTIIVDPPRKGLDSITIKRILELSPQKIVYISCETQKLVEDLKQLQSNYNVSKLYILDMFSYTYHAECFVI